MQCRPSRPTDQSRLMALFLHGLKDLLLLLLRDQLLPPFLLRISSSSSSSSIRSMLEVGRSPTPTEDAEGTGPALPFPACWGLWWTCSPLLDLLLGDLLLLLDLLRHLLLVQLLSLLLLPRLLLRLLLLDLDLERLL